MARFFNHVAAAFMMLCFPAGMAAASCQLDDTIPWSNPLPCADETKSLMKRIATCNRFTHPEITETEDRATINAAILEAGCEDVLCDYRLVANMEERKVLDAYVADMYGSVDDFKNSYSSTACVTN